MRVHSFLFLLQLKKNSKNEIMEKKKDVNCYSSPDRPRTPCNLLNGLVSDQRLVWLIWRVFYRIIKTFYNTMLQSFNFNSTINHKYIVHNYLMDQVVAVLIVQLFLVLVSAWLCIATSTFPVNKLLCS